MQGHRNDADATDHGGDASWDEEIGASDHEASLWFADFTTSGAPVDPDRVWLQIAALLDEVEPGRRSPLVRAYLGAGRALQRAARFATITGGGWGGPVVVGLFAILVIAALIMARTPQV